MLSQSDLRIALAYVWKNIKKWKTAKLAEHMDCSPASAYTWASEVEKLKEESSPEVAAILAQIERYKNLDETALIEEAKRLTTP